MTGDKDKLGFDDIPNIDPLEPFDDPTKDPEGGSTYCLQPCQWTDWLGNTCSGSCTAKAGHTDGGHYCAAHNHSSDCSQKCPKCKDMTRYCSRDGQHASGHFCSKGHTW